MQVDGRGSVWAEPPLCRGKNGLRREADCEPVSTVSVAVSAMGSSMVDCKLSKWCGVCTCPCSLMGSHACVLWCVHVSMFIDGCSRMCAVCT